MKNIVSKNLEYTLPFLLIIIFIFQSCKSPTSPEQKAPPDTTSNNFTFQTYTFGANNAGSSSLQDVAIISDSNIWCVGAVYVDSANGLPDPNAYNAIHWDGNKWELKRIEFFTVCGQNRETPYPAKAICIINDSTLWIGMDGDQIAILNSGKQTSKMCLPVSFVLNKIWSDKEGSIYIVGEGGSILLCRNGNWQKIESGTTTDISDIWGSGNTVLATVTNWGSTGDRKLLQINVNDTVDSLNWSPKSSLQTVWFQSMDKIFIGGGKHIVGKPGDWQEITELPPYYSECVRGNSPNDVFIVGDFGLCAHYNGSKWKTYGELYNSNESIYGLAVKGNLMVAVGQVGSKALIIVGKRN